MVTDLEKDYIWNVRVHEWASQLVVFCVEKFNNLVTLEIKFVVL